MKIDIHTPLDDQPDLTFPMHCFAKTFSAAAIALLAIAAHAQTGRPQSAAGSGLAATAPVRVSPAEQQAELARLRQEIDRAREQLAQTQQEDAKYTGGLIKAQIGLRIEIQRNTIALLENRARAVETGARFVPTPVMVAAPDSAILQSLEKDIAESKERIAASTAQSERYTGGLIKAQIESTKAVQEQTLAMLEQRYLVTKYGLAVTASAAGTQTASAGSTTSAAAPARKPAAKQPDVSETILLASLVNKRHSKQRYEEMIILDMEIKADGLDRPARAIKGVLKVTDLFGEERISIGWDFDEPVDPGQTITTRGQGVRYNQFRTEHRWLETTEQQNMKLVFVVKSILYADGTRRDF